MHEQVSARPGPALGAAAREPMSRAAAQPGCRLPRPRRAAGIRHGGGGVAAARRALRRPAARGGQPHRPAAARVQVSSSTYNLDANLTVLRLYQIRPASINNKVVANILLKALMHLPRPDFQLCVYQLSEKTQVGRDAGGPRAAPMRALAPAATDPATPSRSRHPLPLRSARSRWRRS